MVRHWVLVMLAFTFSLLTGAPLPPPVTTALPATPARSPRSRSVWQETLRQVQSWLAPWARLHLYWQRWSTAPPPPERAALMDHVAHSHPLAAPT